MKISCDRVTVLRETTVSTARQSLRSAGISHIRERASPVRAKVWFHRSRALAWILIGAASFAYGWSDSVTLVWIASLYANVISDWTASEAADDRAVTGRLDRIEAFLQRGDNGEPGHPR